MRHTVTVLVTVAVSCVTFVIYDYAFSRSAVNAKALNAKLAEISADIQHLQAVADSRYEIYVQHGAELKARVGILEKTVEDLRAQRKEKP